MLIAHVFSIIRYQDHKLNLFYYCSVSYFNQSFKFKSTKNLRGIRNYLEQEL